MSKVDVQFLDQGFHRALFDAMPMPVFVVDEDVSILEYNLAASHYLGRERPAILGQRAGDLLHCIRASETPGGCGRAPLCQNCVVRKSVQAAFRGERITRQRARVRLLAAGKGATRPLRITCHPLQYERHSFALLILEGLNDERPKS